jgi:hypothetical protein
LTTKINRSVKELLSFAGDNVTRNLISASRQNMIEVSENDLRKISAIVDRTMEQSLVNGYKNVQNALNEVIDESSTSTKKGRRKR